MISGDTVFRWQIDGSDATLMRGSAQLSQGNRRWIADQILIVSDGSVGEVRNRIVADGLLRGDSTKSAQPISWTVHSLEDPRIEAQHYGGRPPDPVALTRQLPPRQPAGIIPSAIGMAALNESTEPRSTAAVAQCSTRSRRLGSMNPTISREFRRNPDSNPNLDFRPRRANPQLLGDCRFR